MNKTVSFDNFIFGFIGSFSSILMLYSRLKCSHAILVTGKHCVSLVNFVHAVKFLSFFQSHHQPLQSKDRVLCCCESYLTTLRRAGELHIVHIFVPIMSYSTLHPEHLTCSLPAVCIRSFL